MAPVRRYRRKKTIRAYDSSTNIITNSNPVVLNCLKLAVCANGSGAYIRFLVTEYNDRLIQFITENCIHIEKRPV